MISKRVVLADIPWTPKLREAKPGGFPNPDVSPLFLEQAQIVSQTLSGLFLVGALNIGAKN